MQQVYVRLRGWIFTVSFALASLLAAYLPRVSEVYAQQQVTTARERLVGGLVVASDPLTILAPYLAIFGIVTTVSYIIRRKL